MEILLTAILVSVILHTATGHRSIGHNAAIAVGGTVALLVLFASPISGSSMNPVRTLAPDIAGVDFTGWWAYVFGELIGAVIAVAIIALVRGVPNAAERAAAEGGLPELPSRYGCLIWCAHDYSADSPVHAIRRRRGCLVPARLDRL
jgi:aquaporin Z